MRGSQRWVSPVAIGGLVLVVAAVTITLIRAATGGTLAPSDAATVLADVRAPRVAPVIGTLTEHAALLPAPAPKATGDSAELDSLIAGTHTLRVWSDGSARERVALIGALGESDIIRDGTDMWIWSSSRNTSTHYRVPGQASGVLAGPAAMLTPATVTELLLGAPGTAPAASPGAGTSTAPRPAMSVSLGPSTEVAGRPAYELDVTPHDPDSMIGSVHVAVDEDEHIPLEVQIYPLGGGTRPAFELGYSQISFDAPDPAVFRFNPPPGARTYDATGSASPAAASPTATSPVFPSAAAGSATRVYGSGWTSVIALPAALLGRHSDGSAETVQARVRGPWGTARLVRTKLFSVLLVAGGGAYLGFVTPDKLVSTVSAATA